MLGRPLYMDFDGPPPEADWVIQGLLERGAVTVFSADTGAGKSMICASWAVAIMQGKPWLGRETTGRRCMFLDEENTGRIVFGRLKALGMTNADRDNMRYHLRNDVRLGSEEDDIDTLEGVEAFQPDVLFVDTVSAACVVDLNDNHGVPRLYGSILRPIADLGCAVVILCHERKPQPGAPRRASTAVMGARQWIAQADSHLALRAVSDKVREEAISDGVRRSFHVDMEMPKSRDGIVVHERLVFVSEHESVKDPPRWMRVGKLGREER